MATRSSHTHSLVTSHKLLFWLMEITYCPAIFLDYLTVLFCPSRCGSERESITTILRALCGRRCLSQGRWSRSAVARGIWSGRCCGRGSSSSGKASAETAPKVLWITCGRRMWFVSYSLYCQYRTHIFHVRYLLDGGGLALS